MKLQMLLTKLHLLLLHVQKLLQNVQSVYFCVVCSWQTPLSSQGGGMPKSV